MLPNPSLAEKYHDNRCNCSRCQRSRRSKKIGIGAGVGAAAIIAVIVLYPSFSSSITDQLGLDNAISADNEPTPGLLQPTTQQSSDSAEEADEIRPSAPELSQPTTQQSSDSAENVEEDNKPLTNIIPLITNIINQEKPSLDELRKYALEKINEDRGKFGLPPVELSNNDAAQVHAEDVLKTRQISHWMTNGEKPYMTYSRLGGTGHMGQNVGASGDMSYYEDCTSGFYRCDRIDPFGEIDAIEYGMMYDDADSDWGHRDNILHPRHTHVSIGIAYDDYTFVIVQNFEDNYIRFISPITRDGENIQLTGFLPPDTELYGINIFYDEYPTESVYERYRNQGYYSLGEVIAGVAPPGWHYQEIENIPVSNWHESSGFIDIRFSIESIADREGVYTIVTWLNDKSDVPFAVTSYSVFVN